MTPIYQLQESLFEAVLRGNKARATELRARLSTALAIERQVAVEQAARMQAWEDLAQAHVWAWEDHVKAQNEVEDDLDLDAL